MQYEGRCLGGPYDGKSYAATRPLFDVDITPPFPITPTNMKGEVTPPPLQRFTYQWKPLTKKTGVWVPRVTRGWDVECIVRHLIRHYKGTE